MKKMGLALVMLVIASAVATPEKAKPLMMGGTATISGQFPSTVFIETPLLTSCVGVILNQNHIVTSCRCVINSDNQVTNPFFIRIIAGDLNLFSASYRRFTTRASRIYAHPQFNSTSGVNDIAVVRVLPVFPFPHNTIDLVPRNIRVLPDRTNCFFAGWGYDNLANFTAVQQSIIQPILNRNLCNGAAIDANRVTENMICAGSLPASNPPAGVCHGNTGGGLYCNNELVGILSFGMGCGAANTPGVYTQIRLYETWIVQQFARTDSTFPN